MSIWICILLGFVEGLTDFETTNKRFQGFKLPERHFKIDRTKLGIVLFAQDKVTKKVLDPAVAEVTK